MLVKLLKQYDQQERPCPDRAADGCYQVDDAWLEQWLGWSSQHDEGVTWALNASRARAAVHTTLNLIFDGYDPREDEHGDLERLRVAQHATYMAVHRRAAAVEGITEEWLQSWDL